MHRIPQHVGGKPPEAAPDHVLDVAAIAQAIQATGYCVVDDALGKTHAEQLGAACRAVKKAPATIQEGTDRVNDSKRRDDAAAANFVFTKADVGRAISVLEHDVSVQLVDANDKPTIASRQALRVRDWCGCARSGTRCSRCMMRRWRT